MSCTLKDVCNCDEKITLISAPLKQARIHLHYNASYAWRYILFCVITIIRKTQVDYTILWVVSPILQTPQIYVRDMTALLPKIIVKRHSTLNMWENYRKNINSNKIINDCVTTNFNHFTVQNNKKMLSIIDKFWSIAEFDGHKYAYRVRMTI